MTTGSTHAKSPIATKIIKQPLPSYFPNEFVLGLIPKEQHFDRLSQMLRTTLERLNTTKPVDDDAIHRMTTLIHKSMTTRGRVYHSMQHVFDISKEMHDPEIVLSALFHDVVYYSIDKQFLPEQLEVLKPYLLDMAAEEAAASSSSAGGKDANVDAERQRQQQEMPSLSQTSLKEPVIEMVVKMYGFPVGVPLPKFGTNEFLSALVAVLALKDFLQWDHLIRIAACIEATIPFRGTDANGKNPMDRLYDRLQPLCEGKSDDWIITTVEKGVTTANWDLGSFNSHDRHYFLDSTWKLMPEGRPALMREDCPMSEYIEEFRSLLVRSKKMPVPIIFQCFRNFPTKDEMEAKRRHTYENLGFVGEYGKVRLLQLLVLKEFAELMGEDPATLPMRPLLRMDMPISRESVTDESLSAIEKEIRITLVEGRRTSFSWDPAATHLGALLLDALGMDGISRALEVANQQESDSQGLLKSLPSGLVMTLAACFGSVLPDRVEGIMKVPEKLGIMAQ
eukprot:CAMPEP_0119547700 /NCGR_PEP_ID=MMETSP1352-20130426/1756_1 /TAXON_ID=265584 /ORGANISM="Stauroneis constricta, Strain CCMP1120" /LENGTH=506 /DNA_ID=CAMNT_0007592699 /DNA_START=281 /DNA_END=1801 /DNA_ORIENTATION=-